MDRMLRPLFFLLCNVRFACGEQAGRWLFGERDFIIIKNGKDLQEFSFQADVRNRIRKEKSWENKTVIGHVGNFNYQKNHEFLLNIFSDLEKQKGDRDYILVLLGSGTGFYEKAKTKARELSIENRVLFMGSVNNVPELLQGMDIMLLPSRFEGLPNVVLEWQCAGLPCLISDRITKECAVTDLVQYLPIDQGTGPWTERIAAYQIIDREEESRKARTALKENGFDIREDAEMLRKLYFALAEKANK